MIPGFLISFLTFPGVILHEAAHQAFCKLFKVKVHSVKYLDLLGGGHVIHERPETYAGTFWISVGPFVINTIMGFLFALLAATIYETDGALLYALLWLALSFGAHAFPSNQDAKNILSRSKDYLKQGGNPLHYLAYPFIWLIFIANLLRFVWIDFIWAGAVIIIALTISGVSI